MYRKTDSNLVYDGPVNFGSFKPCESIRCRMMSWITILILLILVLILKLNYILHMDLRIARKCDRDVSQSCASFRTFQDEIFNAVEVNNWRLACLSFKIDVL